MSYKLDFDDDLSTSARRAVGEQIDEAAQLIEEERESDPVDAIHGARKNIKKSRAVLRLLRSDLPKKTYRSENRTLRDTARRVSHVRDADVMIETVEKLGERFAGQLPAAVFNDLRDRLEAEASESREQLDQAVVDELVESLEQASMRVDDWPLDDVTWKTAERGIATAYVRGIKEFANADAHPTVDNLHEWRKRVKDLWYHERLLTPAWPKVLEALAEEAHELSDLLGDDHDLAVLADKLKEMDDPPVAVDDILDMVVERRAELLEESRALGRRIYAEKPKAFKRRLRSYARIAAREPALAA